MEGVLVGEEGVPEQALETRNDLAIDELLDRGQFRLLRSDLVGEVVVGLEELGDGLYAGEDDDGFEGDHYFDCRPALGLGLLPEAEEVGGAVEEVEVADPPEAQLVVVEEEEEVLGLPGVGPHVKGDVDEAVVEVAGLDFCGHVVLLLLADVPPQLPPFLEQFLGDGVELSRRFARARLAPEPSFNWGHYSQHLYYPAQRHREVRKGWPAETGY